MQAILNWPASRPLVRALDSVVIRYVLFALLLVVMQMPYAVEAVVFVILFNQLPAMRAPLSVIAAVYSWIFSPRLLVDYYGSASMLTYEAGWRNLTLYSILIIKTFSLVVALGLIWLFLAWARRVRGRSLYITMYAFLTLVLLLSFARPFLPDESWITWFVLMVSAILSHFQWYVALILFDSKVIRMRFSQLAFYLCPVWSPSFIPVGSPRDIFENINYLDMRQLQIRGLKILAVTAIISGFVIFFQDLFYLRVNVPFPDFFAFLRERLNITPVENLKAFLDPNVSRIECFILVNHIVLRFLVLIVARPLAIGIACAAMMGVWLPAPISNLHLAKDFNDFFRRSLVNYNILLNRIFFLPFWLTLRKKGKLTPMIVLADFFAVMTMGVFFHFSRDSFLIGKIGFQTYIERLFADGSSFFFIGLLSVFSLTCALIWGIPKDRPPLAHWARWSAIWLIYCFVNLLSAGYHQLELQVKFAIVLKAVGLPYGI